MDNGIRFTQELKDRAVRLVRKQVIGIGVFRTGGAPLPEIMFPFVYYTPTESKYSKASMMSRYTPSNPALRILFR